MLERDRLRRGELVLLSATLPPEALLARPRALLRSLMRTLDWESEPQLLPEGDGSEERSDREERDGGS